MIKPEAKAKLFLESYGEREGIIQATQCLVMSPTQINKEYWWKVIELIKYDGERYDSL